MKNYIYTLILLTGLFFLGSCSEHEGTVVTDEYVPYFKTTSVAVEIPIVAEGRFSVEVTRLRPTGDAESTVELILPEGISSDMFSLVSDKIAFKDGEFTTKIELQAKDELLELFKNYPIQLRLLDVPVSVTTLKPLTVNVTRELVYEDYQESTFKSARFGFEDKVMVQRVEIQDNDGQWYFKVVDPYFAGYPMFFVMDEKMTEVTYFKDGNGWDAGFVHASYGPSWFIYTGSKVVGKTVTFNLELQVEAGSFGPSPEVLTFP